MKKRSRVVGFAFFCIAIMLLLNVNTALADDVYSEEITVTNVTLTYEDGSNGTIPFNTTQNVFDNWSAGFQHDQWYDATVEDGVKYGAVFENLAEINVTDSITPTTLHYDVDFSHAGYDGADYTCKYSSDNNAIPALRFYVNLSSEDIMNGAQEMWYRSPIYWDSLVYEEVTYDGDEDDRFSTIDDEMTMYYWWLNIYEDETDTLVYATRERPFDQMYEHRMYDHLSMKFKSNTKYRFEEYLRPDSGNSINTIKLYFANQQDIGSDDLTDTYIFFGTTQAKKIPVECSWSMIFTHGIGRAGTEKVLEHSACSDPNDQVFQVVSNVYVGSSEIDDVDFINVTIPFRTTKFVDVNVSLAFYDGPGGDWEVEDTIYIHDCCGTIDVTFELDDDGPTEAPNRYIIALEIGNLSAGDYCTYTMYPSDNASSEYNVHCINIGEWDDTNSEWDYLTYECNHMVMFCEIVEISGGGFSDTDESQAGWGALLLGIAIIFISVFIAKWMVPTGIALIGKAVGTTGLISSLTTIIGKAITLTGYAIAFSGITAGSILILEGTGIIDIGFYRAIVNGIKNLMKDQGPIGDIIRAIVKGIQIGYDFLTWLGNALWDLTLTIVETLKWLGEVWQAHGANILAAIVEFIWFLAFLAILLFWIWFLNIMRYVLHGDFEGAWASVWRPVRKRTGQASKTYKWIKRREKGLVAPIKSYQRKKTAQERQTYQREREARAESRAERESRARAYRTRQEGRLYGAQRRKIE